MHDSPGDQANVDACECELVDVTPMRLADVISTDDPELVSALRRLLNEMDHTPGTVSRWQSYLG